MIVFFKYYAVFIVIPAWIYFAKTKTNPAFPAFVWNPLTREGHHFLTKVSGMQY